MASTLDFNDFEINQTTITGRRKSEVIINAFRPRYKTDPETKQRTGDIEGYNAEISAARGKNQNVKLPLNAVTDDVLNKIITALATRKVVKANFGTPSSTLRGRCYSFINQAGQLCKGVTATATEFNLVAIEEPEFDEYDDFVDM